MSNEEHFRVGLDHVVGEIPPALGKTLRGLHEQGWTMDWSVGEVVVCHLVLYSGARVQGTGPDFEQATREAISRIDID